MLVRKATGAPGFPAAETAARRTWWRAFFAPPRTPFELAPGPLLSGGTNGAVKGAERILEAGGETFAEVPSSALEPRVVETLVQRGLATMVGDAEALIERLTQDGGR
jgi:hypothetical protein